MARFAPVAPIQVLEGMKEAGCLGDYHLLLAHHVLAFPERFKALFEDMPMCTIIMDNSVVELGSAATDARVLEACDIVRASDPSHPAYKSHWIYPVLTDVMSDGPVTREKSTKSFQWWKDNAPAYSPLVVLQGNDWASFTQTADYFLLDPRFKEIVNVGIPRVLTGHLGTRQLAIQYVDALRPDLNVHLLGFSNDVTDDIICCNLPAVQGIDSAVPVRYPYTVPDGFYTPSCTIPPRPEDWFEKGEYTPQIWKNLYAMRQWVA